jgi:Uma2 family endonuclease
MTVPASPLDLDDRNLYPLHKDKDVPETSLQELIARYLRDAIHAHAPHWFVTGNVCVYWERGNFAACCAPDVFVVTEPLPEARPRVYQLWRDPPIRFVAEIVSRATGGDEESIRLPQYQDFLRVPEHLYCDPERGILRLRRLGPAGYDEVSPGPGGRLRSEQLGLEFEMDAEGFLWVYTPEGERLLTHDEEVLRRHEAEARAREGKPERRRRRRVPRKRAGGAGQRKRGRAKRAGSAGQRNGRHEKQKPALAQKQPSEKSWSGNSPCFAPNSLRAIRKRPGPRSSARGPRSLPIDPYSVTGRACGAW